MAGGVGSRFWPKSRNDFPKQFIDILGTGKSLLQQTFERFSSSVECNKIYVITNESYKPLVEEQIPDLPEANIICEPSRNNTAPCIAYAAFKLNKENPNAVMVIVPSDHLILKENEYQRIIDQAVSFAKKNKVLVTLGVQPTRPDTGYGYIQFEKKDESDIFKVNSFKEKPNLILAEEYLQSDQYLWNAGMFIWKASDILQAIEDLAPEIYGLFQKGINFYNTDSEKEFISQNYPLSPNISIDFAILEKAKNVYTIPADIGWSDLGTWNSLHNISDQKDDKNNTLIAKKVFLVEVEDCIISSSENKLVVINGLNDFIVVDDSNVLLIYPKSKEQEIKEITLQLKNNEEGRFL